MTQIRERLFELQDTTYQAFQSKLMPTVDPDTVIGVRTPALRGAGERDRAQGRKPREFLRELPTHLF